MAYVAWARWRMWPGLYVCRHLPGAQYGQWQAMSDIAPMFYTTRITESKREMFPGPLAMALTQQLAGN